MLEKILIGISLVCLTTIIQAFFMVSGVKLAEWRAARFTHKRTEFRRALTVSLFTAWMFLGTVIEVLVWAVLYLAVPDNPTFPDLETSLYFSMATFTTVGYGDVVLSGEWRMLSSMQAANGMIIFGWTTAVIFYFIQKVYTRQ